MESEKMKVYLPIRSLGDFIITASVTKNFIGERIPILLPDYMADLYEAIGGDNLFIIVGRIGLKNQPAFFELYKIKNKKNLIRFFQDIIYVFYSLKRKWVYLLDFRSRRMFFSPAKFRWPPDGINIYSAKKNFFAANYNLKDNPSDIDLSIQKTIFRIIIFPDSRIKDKEIPKSLVNQIKERFTDFEINTAIFSTGESSSTLTYSNFTELIMLIKSADFVISSDSLPYHLANFYCVPHFVVYMKNSKFYTEFFKTPFMIRNNYFSMLEGTNFKETLDRLLDILM